MTDTCECIIDEDQDGCFGHLAHITSDGNRAEVQTEWYETSREVLNAVGWFASKLGWKVPDEIQDWRKQRRVRLRASAAMPSRPVLPVRPGATVRRSDVG